MSASIVTGTFFATMRARRPYCSAGIAMRGSAFDRRSAVAAADRVDAVAARRRREQARGPFGLEPVVAVEAALAEAAAAAEVAAARVRVGHPELGAGGAASSIAGAPPPSCASPAASRTPRRRGRLREDPLAFQLAGVLLEISCVVSVTSTTRRAPGRWCRAVQLVGVPGIGNACGTPPPVELVVRPAVANWLVLSAQGSRATFCSPTLSSSPGPLAGLLTLGDPVSRGPCTSVSQLEISMTCESGASAPAA
jgi:hypothetical protein